MGRSRLAALLALTAIYRILTVDLVRRRLFADSTTDKGAEALLATAKKKGLMRSQRIVGNLHGYSLTEAGAKLVGLSGPCFRKPHGTQAIFTRMLVARFFLGGQMQGDPLTAYEFRKKFPKHAEHPGSIDRFFIDRSGESKRLTIIVPDLNATFAVVANKARCAVSERKKNPEFRLMMYAKPTMFGVAVLTPYEATKPERIREALATEKFHYTVYHVPGLEDLFMFGRGE